MYEKLIDKSQTNTNAFNLILEAKIDENKSQLSHDLERLKTLVAKQPPQYRQEGKG